MTKNEWEDLEPGTEIIYSLKGSDYEGTICRVLDNDDGELTIALIQPGKYGYSTWGNDETTIDGWTSEYAYKFNFLETQTLESFYKYLRKNLRVS